MRDLVATPAVGQTGDAAESAAENALEKAGAALSNGGSATTTVVESTEVSISSAMLRIDLPTPPSSGGVAVAEVKPKSNGVEKHMLGHGCGEDDIDEKRDDEGSNYADAEEGGKPDDAEKPDTADPGKPDDGAKPPVESDTADAPPPVPPSPQEMTEEPVSMPEGVAEGPTGPVHFVLCDGCKNGENIVGVRWKCLECADYDLCDKCHSTGAHDEHEMLRVEHPDDYQSVELAPLVDDADSLLIGLRVYTNRDAPVKISGQLRRGQLMKWRKNL
ncbi:hypothetical protein SCHPADRAFT_101244 [Schizopora paradoxa]|uniref:ZZ-type domain-containing protein n=1 Tax=Schizopora paradoxa TaxID=27342 RepID=A0A0H2SAQ9_9AGAM|nr:hypothetical protein SCHPADRAFT_101244 [Schizopora paradoxa]